MKRFAIAFSIGMLAFALANVVALFVRSDSYDDPDSKERYGFPLLISEECISFSGGVAYHDDPNAYFSYKALWSDVVIAGAVSILAGRIYTAIPRRFTRIEHKI
jgi:hypothetical protein